MSLRKKSDDIYKYKIIDIVTTIFLPTIIFRKYLIYRT
jgi:hypothetical protein